MNWAFEKYHGTGNDFVIFYDRDQNFPLSDHAWIRHICHRRYGIGADGVIVIRKEEQSDFRMIYFNANGKEGSMCGNGARCALHFSARHLPLDPKEISFHAFDGIHRATIHDLQISVEMHVDPNFERLGEDWLVDTGSPHYVQFTDHLNEKMAFEKGFRIRNNDRFREKGTNVNFAEIISPTRLEVITFERGVEDVTLSCGTGVTAAALCLAEKLKYLPGHHQVDVSNLGGGLSVAFEKKSPGQYSNIRLSGPAAHTFSGMIKHQNES